MELYRFSPITSEAELMRVIEYLHYANHELCLKVVGQYLPVAGNLGIFCHDYQEFRYLTMMRDKLTYPEPNYKQKYFRLKQPIIIPEKDGIPAATYEYLYIRQVDPYRSQVGDVDFIMPAEEFEMFKAGLATGEFRAGARLFGRPEENMVELWEPEYDVVSYVVTQTIQERVAYANTRD